MSKSNPGVSLLLKAPLLLLAVVAVLSCRCPAQGTTEQVIVIKQMRFNPPQMTAQPGETIEWKNDDIFSHTVTADDGSFDSGLIDPGHSWKMTFKTPQTVAYHCRPHPNMKATLVVQAAGQAGTRAGSSKDGGASLRFSPPTSPEEFHPILVNFTAALLPIAFLSDVLGRILRRRSLHNAAWWMVLYAALITPFTAIAGWWWRSKVVSALPPDLIRVHAWLGTSAVVLFIVLAVWRWRIYKRDGSPSLAYLTFALIVVLALVYQGSLGGRMLLGRG
jgi:plastocyanin/uncharacterized membrane protein